jgi:hypothetical protein
MAPLRERKESIDPVIRIEAKLDETLDWINGTNETDGAKVRIDRLERFVAVATWVVSILLGSVLTGVVALSWHLAGTVR